MTVFIEPFFVTVLVLDNNERISNFLAIFISFFCVEIEYSIVKALVLPDEKMSVSVASINERGTNVKLHFSTPRDAITKSERPEQSCALPFFRGTVLVVDDEAFVRGVEKALLETLGFRVVEMPNGKAALEFLAQTPHSISCVVLDLMMPIMSGRETFDRLCCQAPEIDVLIASGYNQDRQVEQMVKRGAKGFLQKPFSLKELAEKLAQTMPHLLDHDRIKGSEDTK